MKQRPATTPGKAGNGRHGSVYAEPDGPGEWGDSVAQDFNLEQALEDAGWRPRDLAKATGRTASQIWRWRRDAASVPTYVVTILAQQKRIRTLMAELAQCQRHP